MNTTAICKAIECAGNQAALAKSLGVHPTFVSHWVNGRRPVPGRFCIPIEDATDAQVTRYELRPDIFGDAPAPADAGGQAKERAA